MALMSSVLPHGLSSAISQQLPSSAPTFPSSQIGSQNYLSRVPSLPDNMYGTSQMYPSTSGSRPESSYYPLQSGQTDSRKAPPASLGQHYFVDHMMNPHPYSSLYPGFDINAIRRKNATRETTGPLKAWLRQHKKNPYPTKGEKVMMAISTRMTLTQVSTWFANARRRMKKDKLDDESDLDETREMDIEAEPRDRSGSLSSRVSLSSSEADTSKELSDMSDIDVDDTNTRQKPTKKCVQRLFSPDIRPDFAMDPSSSPESIYEKSLDRVTDIPDQRLPPVSDIVRGHSGHFRQNSENITSTEIPQKSKIWSISEIIGSASNTINSDSTTSTNSSNENYTSYFNYGHYTRDQSDISGYQTSMPSYPYHVTAPSLETCSSKQTIQYL